MLVTDCVLEPATGQRIIRAAHAIHRLHAYYIHQRNPELAAREIERAGETGSEWAAEWTGLNEDSRQAYLNFAMAAWEEFR